MTEPSDEVLDGIVHKHAALDDSEPPLVYKDDVSFGLAIAREAWKAGRLDALEWLLDPERCTDHGCLFGHPGGMGTNSGCRHSKMTTPELRVWLQSHAKRIQAEIAKLRGGRVNNRCDHEHGLCYEAYGEKCDETPLHEQLRGLIHDTVAGIDGAGFALTKFVTDPYNTDEILRALEWYSRQSPPSGQLDWHGMVAAKDARIAELEADLEWHQRRVKRNAELARELEAEMGLPGNAGMDTRRIHFTTLYRILAALKGK